MSNENDLTYIFQNKKTKEIMWFMPVAKLLKSLSAEEVHFDLYNASGNTCQINKMLTEVITKNQFLTLMLKNFASFDIEELYLMLQELAINSRDGWINNTNPLSIIQLFNNNSPSDKDKGKETDYNRNLDISCSGVRDFDIVGVVYDDFLSKYYDKAIKNEKNYKKLLYYRNFNITKFNGEYGKLVTGLSNFSTETFRSELLKRYCFLDSDMRIYNFSDYQDRDNIKALFKLITENVFLHDDKEYNLYKIVIEKDKISNIVSLIEACIHDFLQKVNIKDTITIEYDTETRRFLMIDEKGKLRDATAFIYSTLCDSLKAKNLAKLTGKLKDFIESENNWYIMEPVIASHYEEKFNLAKNIAEYFESDLFDSDLKAIEFTEKEKMEMKKYFFTKSPLEFFFQNPKAIEQKLIEDKNCDIQKHPDKEDSITKYILEKNIDEILTDQGKEFLNMIKKITSDNEYFKTRIKKDEIFEKYQSQNGKNCTYENNSQNKKTKIEFSVLKALIESIDSGSNVAYQNFFVQLSYYLNYFFCNKNNLSKKELGDSIKKEMDKINKKISDIKQKKDEREQEIGKMADEELSEDQYQIQSEAINKKYGTRKDVEDQLSKAQAENTNFKKTIFFQQDVKSSLEASDDNEQPIGLNKFEKYFLGYDENIFDIVRPKIKEFVEANGLFQDKAIEATEDKERIDIKTTHLTDAIRDYLGGVKGKITFGWFNLYLNYVCQHAKMEFDKIMDGVVDQDDLGKNTDTSLSFLITDLIIEYKKSLEEIESDKTNQKLIDSYNDFGVMNLFHLLQSFINAGYIFAYDSNPDDMCEYICNAHEIEFLMNHHPKKLIEEIRQNKTKSIDFLIDRLFKNTSLENNGQIKKLCKMSIYTFSKITASVDHMTQINMAQFFHEVNGVKRNFSNGVMLEKKGGAIGCFMVPIQKALEICKTNAPEQFEKDINEILPELPEGMKWADINQECDLFLDQNQYEMLSPVEASKIFISDSELLFKTRRYSSFWQLLVQRKQSEFNEFLSKNLFCKGDSIFNIVIEDWINNQAIYDTIKMNDVICFINKADESGTKICLNAAEKLISLTQSIVAIADQKIEELNKLLNDHYYVSENELKYYKDVVTKYSIDKLVHFIGEIYLEWNNKFQTSYYLKQSCTEIIVKSFSILEIAFKHAKKDDISKNNDLILWLYLIYKKMNCDNHFAQLRERYKNPLKLSDGSHILKEYKISDGYDAISSKNIFYIDDKIKEFKDYMAKNKFSDLIFLVDDLPKNQENLNAIGKIKNYMGDWLKGKVDSQKFVLQIFGHKWSGLIKETRNPEKLFYMAQDDRNISHVFYAIKTLYKMQSYIELQKLLLSDDLKTNVIKKLHMDEKISHETRKDKSEISMLVDSVEIFSNLVLQQKMKISFTSAVYLIKSISNFFVGKCDAYINDKPDIFTNQYKKYFRGDKNIFSVATDIIGQIPFPANIVMSKEKPFWPDAQRNLLTLCKDFYNIYSSETDYYNMYKGKLYDRNRLTYPANRKSGLWLYLLYKKIFHDGNNNGKLNLNDDIFLLCEYGPDDNIEEIKRKYVFWDDYHVQDFYKWTHDNHVFYLQYNFYEHILSKQILIELSLNHGDCKAFRYLRERGAYQDKYLLESDENNIMQKLYSLCTRKTKEDVENVYYGTLCIRKISFRAALAATKFIHDFHIEFKKNTTAKNFRQAFDRLGPKPLEFILEFVEKIYFADENLNKYVSIDEYNNFLKIVVEEIYFYETEVKDNSIDQYFPKSKKWNLIWYLYCLHQKIKNKNNYDYYYKKFIKVNGAYWLGDCHAPQNLNSNEILSLFYSKNKSPLDQFGSYSVNLFLSKESIEKFSLQIWIKQIKLDLQLFFLYAGRYINKELFNTLTKNMKKAKTVEQIKHIIKKKYYSTLAKNLKQLRTMLLLKNIVNQKTKEDSETQRKTLSNWNAIVKTYKVQDNFKNISNRLLKIIWFDDIQEIVKQLKAKNSIENIENIIIKYNRLITFHEMKNKINKKESIYMLQCILNDKLDKIANEYKKPFITNLKNVADINEAKNFIRSLFFYILIDKAFYFRNRYEIQKKWKERDELINAREETKKKFQDDIKKQIQQKCEERKNKIEAKAKEKTKNMLKKKYCFTLAKNLRQLKDKIKQRDKLKEILEKRQTKMDKEKQIKTLKEWNEKNKRIRSAGFNTIKPEILKKCEERKNKIKAKDKIKKILRRDIFNKLNDKLIVSARNQNETNKHKRSNASSKIKKIIFSAVVDLILAALAIIFLEKIILILALVALAIIFIVCCGFAIKNGRDYKNLGTKISAFEERQRKLNINQQQQIVPGRENVEQNNLIKNN